MACEKLTKLLTESICVTTEEAAATLEAQDWDVLKAAQLLQREKQVKRIKVQRERTERGLFARLFC